VEGDGEIKRASGLDSIEVSTAIPATKRRIPILFLLTHSSGSSNKPDDNPENLEAKPRGHLFLPKFLYW
jgi:hypothetical protein